MLCHGIGQIADNVALRVALVHRQCRARILRRARPQREPLMMLAGQHHIARTGLLERLRPRIGVPFLVLTIKVHRKAVVVVMRPVVLAIVSLGWRARNAHRIQVPLGIGIVLDVVVRIEIVICMLQWRPARHRVKPVVNKDPQLRPRIPIRQRMLIKRFNRRLILHRRLRRAHTAHAHCSDQCKSNFAQPAHDSTLSSFSSILPVILSGAGRAFAICAVEGSAVALVSPFDQQVRFRACPK